MSFGPSGSAPNRFEVWHHWGQTNRRSRKESLSVSISVDGHYHNHGLAMNVERVAMELLLVLAAFSLPVGSVIFQIGPEKPLEFRLRSCSPELTPMKEDTMLFFPDSVKFCGNLKTSKDVLALAKDRKRTTFLQPMVFVSLHEIGSPYRCDIQYLGYGGDYRLSPDLGYYPTCQKAVSQYISHLATEPETPFWNVSNSNCPIQSLPSKYRDFLSCDLVGHRWYELHYKSSIRYEVFSKRRYHQSWANYTTVFLFKPDNFVQRNGNELDWLQRLVDLQVKQKHCQRARFLIRVDEAWPLPITLFIDYRIREQESGYVKYLRHLGNGTLDQWFSGGFPLERSDRTHEVCVQVSRPECRRITLPLCLDIPYNLTISHSSSNIDQLQSQIDHFRPLIKTNCNANLRFFLCSVFAPMCPEQIPQAVTSCRSVCEEVERDCGRILNDFDIEWPSALNCSTFPEEPALCMKPRQSPSLPSAFPPPRVSPTEIKSTQIPTCPLDLVNLDPTDEFGHCAFPCDRSIMFSKENLDSAKSFLKYSAIANSIATAFTFLTFLFDGKRFSFPERAIFFSALSSLFSTLPYLIRLFVDRQITGCDGLPTGRFFLVHERLDNTICVLSFIFHYYFTLSAALWWLILSFTWYLSASRKWVEEEIEKRTNLFHSLAWGIPAPPTIAVLITQKVDASELFGVCSVGNMNPYTLGGFVIFPRVILVVVGCWFILSGFSNMCRERRIFKRRGTDTAKLEKFMFRLGSFVTVYVVPTVIVILSDIYRMLALFEWYPATILCKQNGGAQNCRRPNQPIVEIYLMGFVMTMATGMATILWVLSSKTLISWRRILCCERPNEKIPPISPTTTYAPNRQPQLVTQMVNGQIVNHYIPLSLMSNQVNRIDRMPDWIAK